MIPKSEIVFNDAAQTNKIIKQNLCLRNIKYSAHGFKLAQTIYIILCAQISSLFFGFAFVMKYFVNGDKLPLTTTTTTTITTTRTTTTKTASFLFITQANFPLLFWYLFYSGDFAGAMSAKIVYATTRINSKVDSVLKWKKRLKNDTNTFPLIFLFVSRKWFDFDAKAFNIS